MKKNTIKLTTFELILASLFIVLYIVGAKMAVHVFVISFTLQTLFLLIAAMLLKVRVSVASVCVYIIMGFIGLPVFSQGGGLAYLQTPGAGFLFGFVFMVFTVGAIVGTGKRDAGFGKLVVAGVVGVLVQFIVAILYFSFIMDIFMGGENRTLIYAIKNLFLPFIAADLLKAVIAAIIVKEVKKALPQLKV